MDLRDFGTTLARWWYLALATLLLAIGAGLGMYKATGPTYTANSTVLLLPPKAVLIQAQADKKNYAPNNPLLYLSSLTDARDVLVRHLSSTDVTQELTKKAPDATLTVTGDLTSGSPLILVKSEGPTEKAALDGMKAVDDMVPGTLKSLQDEMKIADLQRINSLEVTEDTKATPESKKQIMSGAVGFAGVTLLGLATIAVLDQRRNRRLGGDEPDDTTRTADEAKKAGSTAVRTQRAVKAGKRA
ncbi:hypothetical protein EDD41_2521 [Luteococcus japonicus]|uniref:Capsular polysaccharide biosynthesis protein n=1 Tax=Luteococcus japonicus TaxID=33984 RepID=A0A3N1ZWM7_9ACTN|nr:hypothetical protein [Luteococcus japonicus]ROR55260.1 hypothetical protein EDD41_2521 [Luteococcus japonicus]